MLNPAQTEVVAKLDNPCVGSSHTNSYYTFAATADTISFSVGNIHFLSFVIKCLTPAGSWTQIGTLNPAAKANASVLVTVNDLQVQLNDSMVRAFNGTANNIYRGFIVYMS